MTSPPGDRGHQSDWGTLGGIADRPALLSLTCIQITLDLFTADLVSGSGVGPNTLHF